MCISIINMPIQLICLEISGLLHLSVLNKACGQTAVCAHAVYDFQANIIWSLNSILLLQQGFSVVLTYYLEGEKIGGLATIR